MPKQKFYLHNVTVRLMDPEYKKLTLACYRSHKNRSEVIRHLLCNHVDSMLTRKSPKDVKER